MKKDKNLALRERLASAFEQMHIEALELDEGREDAGRGEYLETGSRLP